MYYIYTYYIYTGPILHVYLLHIYILYLVICICACDTGTFGANAIDTQQQPDAP